MITNFKIISGATVPNNYTWDSGIPFATSKNNVLINTTNAEYISGYAPGLKVAFKNLSVPNIEFDKKQYTWNFGDFYNDSTNIITLTSLNTVEHIYVMPGKYSVSLRLEQTKTDSTEVISDLLCLGKYDVRWFWDDLLSVSLNNIQWRETTKTKPNNVTTERWRKKQWVEETQCFQKHCLSWTWGELQENQPSPVKWIETTYDELYEKKWQFEQNDTVCSVDDTTFLDTLTALDQTIIKQFIVDVKEIPPVAGFHCITESITGVTPLTVAFTLSTCNPGSFPIDHIDIDFGDKSKVLTLTRYTSNIDNDVQLAVPLLFPNDPDDIRNYIVRHTYVRNQDTYPVFYPSLTCYSACTNTTDSCCIMIGPISFPTLSSSQTNLLKVRNTPTNNLYIFNTNDNLAFLTTAKLTAEKTKPIPNYPPAKFNNTFYSQTTMYKGNSGEDYLNAPEIALR
jgi:hypothetical protein